MDHPGHLPSKIDHFLSTEAAPMAQNPHVLSILKYDTVFCLSAVNSKLEKASKTHNRSPCVCFRANRSTSTPELHSRANLLPLDCRRNVCMFRFLSEIAWQPKGPLWPDLALWGTQTPTANYQTSKSLVFFF